MCHFGSNGMKKIEIPFVVGVVVEKSLMEARNSIKLSYREGADAVELNLPNIDKVNDGLFNAVPIPVYTSCRRAGFMAVYGERFAGMSPLSDVARMEKQLEAFAAGSAGLDIEADTFDPNFDQWSEKIQTVERQREIADTVHDKAGTVIFSWHPPRKVTLSEACEKMQALEGRGADFVKVVERVADKDEAIETLRISLHLRERFNTPFIFLALGAAAVPFRPLMCSFGAAYLLARPSRGGNQIAEQPLISTAKSMIDLL